MVLRDDGQHAYCCNHTFVCDRMAQACASVLPDVPVAQILVLTHIVAVNDVLHSNAHMRSLQSFLDTLPVPTEKCSEVASKPNQLSGAEAARREFPWLEHFWERPSGTAGGEGAYTATTEREPADDDVLHDERDPMDEATVAEVFAELDRKRLELLADEDDEFPNFGVSLLGGPWTAEHHGVVADAFKAFARGSAVTKWCVRHSVNASARFDISLYAERAAILARAWAHKAQYHFNVSLAAGAANGLHHFTPAELGAYVEPVWFVEAATWLLAAGNRQAATRIAQIRGMFQ